VSALDGWRILAFERRQRRIARARRELSDTGAQRSTPGEWCVAIVATTVLIGAVLLVVRIIAGIAGVP